MSNISYNNLLLEKKTKQSLNFVASCSIKVQYPAFSSIYPFIQWVNVSYKNVIFT